MNSIQGIILIAILNFCVAQKVSVLDSARQQRLQKYIRAHDNAEFQNYCSDCFTATFCSGESCIDTTCELGTQACIEEEETAACTNVANVTGCSCQSYPSSNPDIYDEHKYFFCLEEDGPPIPEDCSPEVYDPTERRCEPTTTVGPTTTEEVVSPINCTQTDEKCIILSCYSYELCVRDEPYVYTCEHGDIVNECEISSDPCELYKPFTCATHLTSGFYADSDNCSVFHVCQGGVETVPPQSCDEDFIFDPIIQDCVNETETDYECVLRGCSVPIPDDLVCDEDLQRYQINSDSYYQCTKTPDGSYELIPTECPGDYIFDQEQNSCVAPPLKKGLKDLH